MSDGGNFDVTINGVLIAQNKAGYVPDSTTPKRSHMSGTYTPTSTGLHELKIYNYRNAPRTALLNYIEDILLVPAGADLTIDPSNISVAAAGSATLTLDLGPAHAGENYIILAGASSSPNFMLDGVLIHLAYDFIFQYSLSNKNTAMFSNTYGVLDASGQATATFNTFGALPHLMGNNYSFCGLGLSSGGVRPITWASNPVLLNMIP